MIFLSTTYSNQTMTMMLSTNLRLWSVMTISLCCWICLVLPGPCSGFAFHMIPQQPTATQRTSSSQLQLTTISSPNDALLSPSVYQTIQEGNIAVIPNFVNQADLSPLRQDAQSLWQQGHYTTDALASYGTSGNFDPTKDRAVLRLAQWKNNQLGNYETRQRLGDWMSRVRSELAVNLDRPQLAVGNAVSMYGHGSTEISYTRFGPGAFLQRHVDEHHEELKGVDGWAKPTRRSISWLLYLNDADWQGSTEGGQLRCFQRKLVTPNSQETVSRSRIGAAANGDLQIAWLRSTPTDPVERPVYLDAQRHDHGDCQMYIQLSEETDSDHNRRHYISKAFRTNPILYMAGSELLVKKTLLNNPDLADRFHLIEPPKSKLSDLLMTNKDGGPYCGQGLPAYEDEELRDVDPRGGTLVLFDSVSLPHEVLATKTRERWACSGWFHEDQQPVGGRVV